MLKRFPVLIGAIALLLTGILLTVPESSAQGVTAPFPYFRRLDLSSSSASSGVASAGSSSSRNVQPVLKTQSPVRSSSSAPCCVSPEKSQGMSSKVVMPKTGAGDGTKPVENLRAFLRPVQADSEDKGWFSWLW